MQPEVQIDFIKNHLKPAFIAHQLETKILSYDHNWDRPDYPLTVLEQANEEVDGVALPLVRRATVGPIGGF